MGLGFRSVNGGGANLLRPQHSDSLSQLCIQCLFFISPFALLLFIATYWIPEQLFEGASHYAPLHSILEIFSVTVAILVFGVSWNTLKHTKTFTQLILASVFLSAALFDLGHLLSYKGMPDFMSPNSAHKAILLWLAARYIIAFGLVMLSLVSFRHWSSHKAPSLVLSGILGITIILLITIAVSPESFPKTFIEDQGLTPLKTTAEYILVFLYFLAAFLLLRKVANNKYDPGHKMLAFSAAVMAISEFCFTLYIDVADTVNLLGHIYKVIAYVLIYHGLVRHNIRTPYQQLENSQRILKHIAESAAGLTGQPLFNKIATELAIIFNVRCVLIGELVDKQTKVKSLARVKDGEICPSTTYLLTETPCEIAVSKHMCVFENDVQTRFPDNKVLKKLGAISYAGNALRDSNNQVIGVLALVDDKPIRQSRELEDIMRIMSTRAASELERAKLEHERIAYQNQLQSFLENMQDAVFQTNPDHELIWISPSASDLTGYSTDELLGTTIEEYFTSEQYHQFIEIMQTNNGIVSDYEVKLKRKDKTAFWAAVNAHHYHDKNGHIAGIEGSVHDIERRKQAEAELQLLNAELENKVALRTRSLEQTNQELESFSYSVSHDLRAPLRAIKGFSQLIIKKYNDALDDTGRDYLHRVEQGCNRMGNIIDGLLSLSRIGRSEIQKEHVDLSELATKILAEKQQQEPWRNVETNIQPDIVITGDRDLLFILMENFLENAWKYSKDKSPAKIEFGRLNNDERTIFIRDNGIGFNMQYADKLFTPFQRLHSDDEFQGNGIGLATVQRIISRHNGTVWTESTPDNGATFFFQIM